MKKILIIGADLPINAQIQEAIKEQDLDIVVNNIEVKDDMRKQYLNTYQDLEPLLEFSETKIYEKPKSKFHK